MSHSIQGDCHCAASLDAWWEVGTQYLLSTSNLQTLKVLFRYELWPNDSPFQGLAYRSTSDLDALLVELDIKEKIGSRTDKIKRIIDELLDRPAYWFFEEEKAVDTILQQPTDLAAAQTLEAICRLELSQLRFPDWLEYSLYGDVYDTVVEDYVEWNEEMVRCFFARIREDPLRTKSQCHRIQTVSGKPMNVLLVVNMW